MRLISTFLMLFSISFSMLAIRVCSNNMLQDTIDYDNTRLYIDIPNQAYRFSKEISDCEGFVVMYPLKSESGHIGILTVDYSVMNDNQLVKTTIVDKELWNTFNRNHTGSRSFIRDGQYYRIDRFSDGLEIYYTGITKDLVNLANDILSSVKTKKRTKDDKELDPDRRRRAEL